MIHFYSKIIEIETVTKGLSSLDLTDQQKIHLAQLVDSTINHSILELILGELSESDRQIFIEKLESSKHQEILEFLDTKIDNLENKIKKVADELKTEIHSDIKAAKTTKL
jgi:ribosomal protein S13